MHIVIIGVDHNTAPIELRERLACSNWQAVHLLQKAKEVVSECILLSTCNRVELYALCPDPEQGCSDLLKVLCDGRQVAIEEIEVHCYSYVGTQVVEHLFSVACGLHSLVPGEPQIQGQIAQAMEVAQGCSSAGPILSALFRAALVAGKRARTETGISRNAVSISHVAVQLARHLLPDLLEAHVLLVGSGTMSELAARNLRDNGARRLVIVNRTQSHAVELAESLQATHRPFSELAHSLTEASVVISSTTAPRAIITLEMMQQVMEMRAGRSILLIDLALPRDIDPAIKTLPGVHLYNLDDLQAEVDRGLHLRRQEIAQVTTIIQEEVKAFERWQASLSVVGTISDIRQHIDMLRQQEVSRTLRQLTPSLSEREIASVQEMSNRLVNKLLHIPTLRLKEAAAAGQGHIYAEALRYLFGLEETTQHATHHNRNTSQQARYETDTVDCSAVTSTISRS